MVLGGLYSAYTDIDSDLGYELNTSLHIEGYDSLNRIAVFHIPYWYGDKNHPDNFNFEFTVGEIYNLVLRYRIKDDENHIEKFGYIYMNSDIDNLQLRPGTITTIDSSGTRTIFYEKDEYVRFWEFYAHDFISYAPDQNECDNK